MLQGLLHPHAVPKLVVGPQLIFAESRNLHLLQRLADGRVVEQVGRNFLGIGVYLSEEAEPEHHHALVGNAVGRELGQFDEREVQTVNHLVAVLVVYDAVVVDEAVGHVVLEDVVHEIEGIHGLQFAVFLLLHGLGNVELGGVEEHALLEGVAPFHLHLHAKLPALDVLTEHIHDGVLVQVQLGHEFCGQILDAAYLLVLAKRQQCVEKACQQVGVLAENLLEGQVGLGIQIFHILLFLNVTRQR